MAETPKTKPPEKKPQFKPELQKSRWKKSELWAFRNVRGTKETLIKALTDFRFPAKTADTNEVRPGLPAEVLAYLTWVINSRTAGKMSGTGYQMDCKADSADGSDFAEHLHIVEIM